MWLPSNHPAWLRVVLLGAIPFHPALTVAQAPTPTNNELQEVFDELGEPIDAFNDGNVEPTTFTPDCVINFEFIGKGFSIFNNQFGWYNVQGHRPTVNELYPLIGADDEPGFVATLDIREDSRYAGGEIGFWLKTPEGCPDTFFGGDADIEDDCGYLYFSEAQWSDDGGDTVHLLIFDSPTRRGFYFAWEDLFEGGDNDFSDFITFVSNIACTGAGEECETGEEGICAVGTMQCVSGDLTCVRAQDPRPEACNGLDDDCDGRIDNGDDLCGPTEICRFGECVERCLGGEVPCPVGKTCVSNVCVDNSCADVACDGGQVCREGECRAPCDGVVCPGDLSCLEGACVDLCEGVQCTDGLVCEGGVCHPACACAPGRCEEQDRTCGSAGTCVEPGCDGVMCPSEEVCRSGTCADACEGAVCPDGTVCEGGRCRAASPPDAGRTTPDPDTDTPLPGEESPVDAGTGADGDGGSALQLPEDHACVCHVVGARSPPPLPAALAVSALGWIIVRRLRRRRSPTGSSP
jgi:hypothetical protein